MMQCLIFLFIAGVSQLNGLPYAEKHADYYSDDYNYSSDDYPNGSGDGDENFSNHLGENEKVIHVTPIMKSKNSDKYTNEGDLIKLPCVVDNLEGHVLMWLKGDKILSLGNNLMKKDNRRMKLQTEENQKNQNTLIISNAEPADAGNYVCRVSANSKAIQVTHKVHIRVAPVVKSDPANGQLIVMEGETASLGCSLTRGSPAPEIKWKRKERKFVDGREEMSGSQLTFFKVTRHHTGIYNCSANNGFSSTLPATASKTITLDVHHKPKIDPVEQTFIHTKEDDRTEIVCIVHASPRATVDWLKNGQPLQQEQGITSKIGNRHSLELPAKILSESKFGVYTCNATNKYGSDAKMIEVSGKAGPPNFKSEQEGTQEHTYSLEWVSESTSPITSFRLEYRVDDGDRSYLQQRMQKSYLSYHYTTESDTSNTIEDTNEIRDKRDGKLWKVVKSVNEPISNGEHMYTGRYTLTGLKDVTNYVARVSSRNDYGFSRPSPASYFYFGTKGAAPLPHPLPGTSTGASLLRNEGGYKSATAIISIISISLYSHFFHLAFNSRSFLSCL